MYQNPVIWKDSKIYPKICDLLEKGNIKSIKPMKEVLAEQQKKIEFEGNVFLITLTNGVQAVFKDCSNHLAEAQAEVAA